MKAFIFLLYLTSSFSLLTSFTTHSLTDSDAIKAQPYFTTRFERDLIISESNLVRIYPQTFDFNDTVVGTSISVEVQVRAQSNDPELKIYLVQSSSIAFRCLLKSSSGSDLYVYTLTHNPHTVDLIKSMVLFRTNYGNFAMKVNGRGRESEYRLIPPVTLAPINTMYPIETYFHNPHPYPISIADVELILYKTDDMALLEHLHLHVHSNSALLGVKQSTVLHLFSVQGGETPLKINLQLHGHAVISIKSLLTENSLVLSLPFVITFLYEENLYIDREVNVYNSVTIPPGKSGLFEKPLRFFHNFPGSMLLHTIVATKDSYEDKHNLLRFITVDYKPIYIPTRNSTAFKTYYAGTLKVSIPPDADLPILNHHRVEFRLMAVGYEERLFETPSDELQAPTMSDESCLFYDNCQLFLSFRIHHYFTMFFSTGELVPNTRLQLHSSSPTKDIPLRLSNLFESAVGVYGVLVSPHDSAILEAVMPERLIVIPAKAKDFRFGSLNLKRKPHVNLGQCTHSTQVTVLTNMTNVNISLSWFSGHLELTHPSKRETVNGTWMVDLFEPNARLSFTNSNPHQVLLTDAYIYEIESKKSLSLLTDSFWLEEEFANQNFQTDKSRKIRPGKVHDLVLDGNALRQRFKRSNSSERLALKLCIRTDYEDGCGFINLFPPRRTYLKVSPANLELGVSETKLVKVDSSYCFRIENPPEIEVNLLNCSHFSVSVELELGFTVGSMEGQILFKLLRELKQKSEYRTIRAVYDRLIYHSMVLVKRFRESALKFSPYLGLRVISDPEEVFLPVVADITNQVPLVRESEEKAVLLSRVLRETLAPEEVYSEDFLFRGLRHLYEKLFPDDDFQTPAKQGRANPCPDCGTFSFEGHLETFILKSKEQRNLTVFYSPGESPLRHGDIDILLIFNNYTTVEGALLRGPVRDTSIGIKVDDHVAYSYSIIRAENNSFAHNLCTMFQSSTNPIFLPIERILDQPVETLRELIPEKASPLAHETAYDQPDAMISFTLTPKFSVHPISTSMRVFPWTAPFCYLEEKLFLKTGLPFDQICFSPAIHASLRDQSEATIYNNMIQNHQIEIKATGAGDVVIDSAFLTHSEETRRSIFAQYGDTFIAETAPERWWKESMLPLPQGTKHSSYMELWRLIFQGQEPLCTRLLTVDQRPQLFTRDPPLTNEGYHLKDFENAQCDMFGLALMNCYPPGGNLRKVIKAGESIKLYLRYEPDLVRYSFRAQLHIRAFLNITEGLIPIKLRPIILSVDYPKDVLEKASTIFQRDTAEFDFWIFFCLVSMLVLMLVIICATAEAFYRLSRHASLFRERYSQERKSKSNFKLCNFIRSCKQQFKTCLTTVKNYFQKWRQEKERQRKRSIQMEKSKLVALHQKKFKKQRKVSQPQPVKEDEKPEKVEEKEELRIEEEEEEDQVVEAEERKEQVEEEEEEEMPEWCESSESDEALLDSMVRGSEELSRQLKPQEKEEEEDEEEMPEWGDSSGVESDEEILESMVRGAEELSRQLRPEVEQMEETETVQQTPEVMYHWLFPPERPAYFCGPGISDSIEDLWKPLEESHTFSATVCVNWSQIRDSLLDLEDLQLKTGSQEKHND